MSQITHLLNALSGPLLVEPRFGALLADVLARKLAGAQFTGAELHAELGISMPSERPEPVAAARGDSHTPARVQVIPIHGVIAQHAHSMGASTERIREQMRAALTSRSVDAVLFDVDSPGGSVSDVFELAADIREARKVKPMAAVAHPLAASAAYALAAAAGDITVQKLGGVGSIGVYTIHEDFSKAHEQDGVKATVISAGRLKMEGSKYGPLDEEGKAFLQGMVDEAYGMFVASVATDRRDTQANVRAGYGEGRVLLGDDAVRANLADRVGTFDDAFARLAAKVERGSAGRSKAWRERELSM